MEESSGMVEAHKSASAQLWKERSLVVMELEGKMAVEGICVLVLV